MAAMKASQERMEALMDVNLEVMESCLGKSERNQNESMSRRDGSGDYRSTGGRATGHGMPEPTGKADKGQCCTWNPYRKDI
jgi:hypothetical protein